MSTALATRGRANTGDIVRSLEDVYRLSEVLVRSGMLPSAIRTPEAAAAIILKGRELGVGAMEAFAGITVIQGKPTVSPQLMLSLINRSGLMCDMDVSDDGSACTVMMHRRGRSNPHRETFSMQDAKGLGLAGKDNWIKQPKVMRKWRAVAACARVVFPDVIAGMYTHEELGAEVDEDGEIVHAEAVEVEPERPALPSNNTGHGSGAYAPPAVVAEYKQWVARFAAEKNSAWLDHHTDEFGEVHPAVAKMGDLIRHPHHLANHLAKFARDAGLINAQEDEQLEQSDKAYKVGAVAWTRDREVVEGEAADYARKLWRERTRKLREASAEAEEPAFEEGTAGVVATEAEPEGREPGSDDDK